MASRAGHPAIAGRRGVARDVTTISRGSFRAVENAVYPRREKSTGNYRLA